MSPRTEFRFRENIAASFAGAKVLRSQRPGSDDEALVALAASNNVMAPAFPLTEGEGYELWTVDPLCRGGAECEQLLGAFSVVEQTVAAPPPPIIAGADMIPPWSVGPCHNNETFNGDAFNGDAFNGEEGGDPWLHVSLQDVGDISDFRLEVEVRFLDVRYGTERVALALPPTAETSFGPGAVLPATGLPPSTSFSVAATLVGLDGTRSETSFFESVTALQGFACAPPDPGPIDPDRTPPGEVTAGVVQALSTPPFLLLGVLAFWRVRRWGVAGDLVDVRTRLRT